MKLLFWYCLFFGRKKKILLRSDSSTTIAGGDWRDQGSSCQPPVSAVCSVVWWVGFKAGVWQVGLINGCSVAVSIQTPALSTPSLIVVWSINGVRAWWVTGPDLWSSCVMRPVNSCWTCSDARNIGRYKSSRFDTILPVSVPIRYRSDNRPFSFRRHCHSALLKAE